MAPEEFRGGVCGGTWWNPPHNLLSGDGGCEIGGLGWSKEVSKNRPNIHSFEKNNSDCDVNSLVFPLDMNSTLDVLDNTQWNQQNLFCDGGDNDGNFNSISRTNLPTIMDPNFSSNTPRASSMVTCEGGLQGTFPMSSSTSYLIQPVLANNLHKSQPEQSLMSQKTSQTYSDMTMNKFFSTCSWVNPTSNSLQSRWPLLELNQSPNISNEVSNNGINEQLETKRPRIETPSPLPTFKVRKEKLGDHITALQQLVSPFGKTDTASVLNEAIEYIQFLHDQTNVLCTPYLNNSGATIQHYPQDRDTLKNNNNDDGKLGLKSRGLCLVPISSTYPIAQETSVDFWIPTFEGTPFG